MATPVPSPVPGLDELTAILVQDRDGVVAGLQARMQESLDAYRDPWLEGRAPRTSGQFADALPLIPLPLVPVCQVPVSQVPVR